MEAIEKLAILRHKIEIQRLNNLFKIELVLLIIQVFQWFTLGVCLGFVIDHFIFKV